MPTRRRCRERSRPYVRLLTASIRWSARPSCRPKTTPADAKWAACSDARQEVMASGKRFFAALFVAVGGGLFGLPYPFQAKMFYWKSKLLGSDTTRSTTFNADDNSLGQVARESFLPSRNTHRRREIWLLVRVLGGRLWPL
jgi:hypothetical protein